MEVLLRYQQYSSAPLPRLSIYLSIYVREVCTLICIPGYQLSVQYHVTRFPNTRPQLVPTLQPVALMIECCQV